MSRSEIGKVLTLPGEAWRAEREKSGQKIPFPKLSAARKEVSSSPFRRYLPNARHHAVHTRDLKGQWCAAASTDGC